MEAAHPLSAALHGAREPLLPSRLPRALKRLLQPAWLLQGEEWWETQALRSDLGACGETGPVNCFPLGGCAGRRSCACGRGRRIELRPEAATWLCCLGNIEA